MSLFNEEKCAFRTARRPSMKGLPAPLFATIVATPGGFFAFPYFAFAKYTAQPSH